MKKKLFILGIAVSLLIVKETVLPVYADNNINLISEGLFTFDNMTTEKEDDVVFDVDDLTALVENIYEIKSAKDAMTTKVTSLQGKVETLKETCK